MPLSSELKELFQFCPIYRYIFHKIVSEKLITLIINPTTGKALTDSSFEIDFLLKKKSEKVYHSHH